MHHERRSRDGGDVELEDEIKVMEGTEAGRHALLSGHNSGSTNNSKAVQLLHIDKRTAVGIKKNL